MTTTQVETYVQERFNMGLREFIKQKVGVENLYDYEVADIMSVDSSLIGKLRKHLGLKKATVFPRQFERSYGEGAVERFKNIIEKPNNSLADAARHFGFCREYSRQVYEKIYGYPYTETFRSKRVEKRRRLLDERIKPKRIKSLIKVTEKMESMGLSSHLTTRKHVHQFFSCQRLISFCGSSRIRICKGPRKCSEKMGANGGAVSQGPQIAQVGDRDH
jgi:AraC-like DNA-binding protein